MACRPGSPGIYAVVYVTACLAAGFIPLGTVRGRAEAHRLARHDALPALKGGVSSLLPTAMDCGPTFLERRAVQAQGCP